MKRLIPFLAAVVIGCGGAAAEPTKTPAAAAVQAVVEAQPTTVAHDRWSITLPPDWQYDDRPVPDGDTKQVLEASSKYNVGRGPIKISVATTDVDPRVPDLVFAMQVVNAARSGELMPGSRLMKSGIADVDGRAGAVMIYFGKMGSGMLAVAFAADGTGYFLACGGDATAGAGPRVAKTCGETLKTFHVK